MRLRGLNMWLILLVTWLSILLIILFLKKLTSLKDKRIYQAARGSGCSDEVARIIVAQARHETGNYTSYIARFCNNYFGMMYHFHKPGHLVKISKCKNDFAAYESLEDSVKDLVLWLEYAKVNLQSNSIPLYVAALKEKKYFEDTPGNYTQGMIRAYKRIKI